MKILWLSHSVQRGGAELVLLEAACALKQDGFQITVGLDGDGPLKSALATAGIKTAEVYLPWWADDATRPRRLLKSLRALFLSTRKVARLISEERPDVVVTNTLALGSPALAAFFKRVPHAWMIHEFMDEDHGIRLSFSKPLSLIYASLLSRKIFFASDVVRRHFSRFVAEEKVSTFPYWVEVTPPSETSDPPKADFLRLVMIGTKQSGKGQHIAIEAVGILKEQGIDASLELVGPGVDSYEAMLRGLTKDLGLEDRIFFISGTTDPFRYSAGADAVLVCSTKEAFGRVTVEGMKLGRVVISSDTGAGPELIRDGETGLLFRYPDPGSLADAVMRLVNEPTLKSRLGEAARTWSEENISKSRYTSNLRRFLEEAMR